MIRLIYILLIGSFLLAHCSCTSVKHLHTSVTEKTDTVRIVRIDTMRQAVHDTTVITSHDTVIRQHGYDISQTFTPDDLAPVHTASGKAVVRTIRKDTGNLHVTVTIEPAGNVQIHAWDDSTQTIIQNLQRIVIAQHDSISRLAVDTTDKSSHTAVTQMDKMIKTRLPWWLYAACAFVVLCIVVQVFIKLGKVIWK